MLLPIKPICDKNKIRKDGTSLIFLQYCFCAESKTLLNTEIAIPPNHWHKKLCRVKDDIPQNFGEAAVLNSEISRQLRLAEDIISYALKHVGGNPVAFVKKTFHPHFNISSLKTENIQPITINEPLNLKQQFDSYIEIKRKRVTPASMHVFTKTLNYLEAFEHYKKTRLEFTSFNYAFYDEFIDFLIYEYRSPRYKKKQGLRTNTIGKAIKTIRLFLIDRMKRKLIPHMDVSMFKTMEEQTDAIYLSMDEIDRIYRTDLSGDFKLEQHRALFVLGCYTGLRFSDLSIIRVEDIRDNMLYKKQQKSDHWVIIPLRSNAKNILQNTFRNGVPKIHNSEFNESIKEIGKRAELNQLIKFSYKKGNKKIVVCKPKYEWITSHTCRRSFCTNEFLAGTPVELIMKISGHKSLKDFYKYIKVTPEQAAEKIKEIWLSRGELKIA